METVIPKTPMMAQWYACKKKAKDALLLFRLGDFYEAFYEDAAILAKELELTLTKRQNIPMSGVPVHAAEGYIEKLITKGFLVAIAEQVEDAKEAKGLVKRDIVQTISPGTILNGAYFKDKGNNFFACISYEKTCFALALLDLSTGELRALEFESETDLQDELFRCAPSEVLIAEKQTATLGPLLKELKQTFRFRLSISKESYRFHERTCEESLIKHFDVHNLDGYGLKEKSAAICALGALLAYIKDDLHFSIDHIKQVQVQHLSSYMAIDKATQRNLELTSSLHQTGQDFTLLKLLDRTVTPMGSRLFKSWVTHPLLSVSSIEERQEATKELLQKREHARKIKIELQNIRDLERMIMRIATGYSTPRDLSGLADSLEGLPTVKKSLSLFKSKRLKCILDHLADPSPIVRPIREALVDDPPAKLAEGHVIRPGFHAELDELRLLKSNSQNWITRYQSKLKEELGIKTLKIIFSKAFGYCIEVSRGQASHMPPTFERRQTLVNSERFISPELKDYEEKILTADEKIQTLEQTLYHALRKEVAKTLPLVKKIAKALANLDCLLSLMKTAEQSDYCCPTLEESGDLQIDNGRHPVIEAALLQGAFISNDTHLNQDTCQMMLITGPNMAGKSTYIRQVALIVIMAQIGSFVPASSARIGIIDKVFSRIGASDDLARGQSTFMVEMTETANILRSATSRSLVILDEIGRGTSTYDGISIAWSVAEYLLSLQNEGVKTLFATHYWELTALEQKEEKVKNFNVAVKETSDDIVFMRKILPGCTDKSYGIHVARLAGLPSPVLKRAYEKLRTLENKESPSPVPKKDDSQLPLFSAAPPISTAQAEILDDLKLANPNQMTPLDALQKLSKWQDLLHEL